MCLSLLTSITTSISSKTASGAGQSSHRTNWTLVGMAPSREDSQDTVVGWWSGGSSGTTRVQWSSPHPAESHSKEKFNKGVIFDPSGMGQGMPTTLSCCHCTEPGWRHPHPLLLLQRSHPWTVHSPMGAGSNCCCPVPGPPWPNAITDAGFSQSRELSGGQHTTTSVCADLAHLSELQHSWTLALHKVLKGTSHVLVTDGS